MCIRILSDRIFCMFVRYIWLKVLFKLFVSFLIFYLDNLSIVKSSTLALLFLPSDLLCVLSHFSCVRLFATTWTVALQAPLSMGFSRQEYWSWLLCPPPGDLPKPVIKPRSPSLQASLLLSEPPRKPMYTSVGSLSLLQGVSLTQESNGGLLHYRWRRDESSIKYEWNLKPNFKFFGYWKAKRKVVTT